MKKVRSLHQTQPEFVAMMLPWIMLGWLIGKYKFPKSDPVIQILIERGLLDKKDFE